MLERPGIQMGHHGCRAHPSRPANRGHGRLSGSAGAINLPSRDMDGELDSWHGIPLGVAALEPRWNRETGAPALRRVLGTVAVLLLAGIVGGAAFIIERGFLILPFGLIGVGVIASTLIAQRSLHQYVARVADALDNAGLVGGREAVSHIVSRDTKALDEAGVARAAIESLAENFSDGVVAPVFWMIIAGLPGAAIYKAVNTADSMIGHHDPRFQAFGWAAARFDDLLNLPASRLSALLIIAAASITKGTSASAAWRAVRRDARHH